MPFKSQAQRGWMYANEPEMAKRWEAHTPKGKQLPERKGSVKKRKKKAVGYGEAAGMMREPMMPPMGGPPPMGGAPIQPPVPPGPAGGPMGLPPLPEAPKMPRKPARKAAPKKSAGTRPPAKGSKKPVRKPARR